MGLTGQRGSVNVRLARACCGPDASPAEVDAYMRGVSICILLRNGCSVRWIARSLKVRLSVVVAEQEYLEDQERAYTSKYHNSRSTCVFRTDRRHNGKHFQG